MASWITLTEPVFSQGRYFKAKEQLCYVDRIKMEVTCPLCQPCYRDQVVIHYRVYLDEVWYYIPEYAAVIIPCVLRPEHKDVYKEIEQENIQPKDFIKTMKELTGHVIDNTYKSQHNRQMEISAANFDTYGNADPSKAMNTQNALRKPLSEEECMSCEDASGIIHPLTKVSLNDRYDICLGSFVDIVPIIEGPENRLTFIWSTGATTRDIQVSPTEDTVYIITVTDDLGCHYTASTIVNVHTLEGYINEGFDGGNVRLWVVATGGYALSYLWSTGETTPSITVPHTPGEIYTVEITDDYCSIILIYEVKNEKR